MFEFTHAVRQNTPFIIVASGASGTGKTYTLLELAMGLKGDSGKVAMIDTEGNRALIYADYFDFDHCELRPPYNPKRFLEALQAAEKRGYKVIIVDSFSDSYVGEGGMVDMAAEEEKRVRNTAASWARPKAENKLVVRWFRQSRCHVLLALRAEEKVRLEKIMKDGREQTIVVPIGFQMVCEKNLPFEATMSFMLKPDAPGVPNPVKLPEQFRQFFPPDKPITRAAGRALAAWAAGATDGGGVLVAQAYATAERRGEEMPRVPAESTLFDRAKAEAACGTDHFKRWWETVLTRADRVALKDRLAELRKTAADADRRIESPELADPKGVAERGSNHADDGTTSPARESSAPSGFPPPETVIGRQGATGVLETVAPSAASAREVRDATYDSAPDEAASHDGGPDHAGLLDVTRRVDREQLVRDASEAGGSPALPDELVTIDRQLRASAEGGPTVLEKALSRIAEDARDMLPVEEYRAIAKAAISGMG